MRLKSLSLFFIFLFNSCGPGPLKLSLGKLSSKDLKTQMGEPVRIESNQDGKEVYVYPEEQKFQVNGETVEAKYRKPSPEEEFLLYWRHKFKKKKTVLKRLPIPKDSHVMAEQELSCPEEGITIIYDPNIDKVTRVYEYAKTK
jgi:hypothetical protein